jgi:hypothetical protein
MLSKLFGLGHRVPRSLHRAAPPPRTFLNRRYLLRLEQLETRLAPYTSAIVNGVLTITPDPSPNGETITLDHSTSGPAMTFVESSNGSNSPPFDDTMFTSIQFNPQVNNDTFKILRTVAGKPVTITEGNGNDGVYFQPADNTMDDIQGNVTVVGGSGANSLNIMDGPPNGGGGETSLTYTITSSSVTRTNAGVITYSGVQSFSINGDLPGQNATVTFNINSTGSGSQWSIGFSAANTVFTIGGTGSSSTLTINGGMTMTSLYTINNTGASSTVSINSYGSTATYQVNNTGANSTLNANAYNGTATFNLEYTGANSISNLSASSSTTSTFNFSPAAKLASVIGHLEGTFYINANNSSNSTLNFNDVADGGNNYTYVFAYNPQLRMNGLTFTNVNISIFFIGIAFFWFNGGESCNTYYLVSFVGVVVVTIHGNSGNDMFQVGNANEDLNQLPGTYNLTGTSFGGMDVNQIVFDDQNDSFWMNPYWGITGTSVTRNMGTYNYSGFPTFTLNGFNTSSIYNIDSTAAGTAYTVNTGNGNDSVWLSRSNLNFASIAGSLTLNGGLGNNDLTMYDNVVRNYTVTNHTITGCSCSYYGFNSLALYTNQLSTYTDATTPPVSLQVYLYYPDGPGRGPVVPTGAGTSGADGSLPAEPGPAAPDPAGGGSAGEPVAGAGLAPLGRGSAEATGGVLSPAIDSVFAGPSPRG